jgi:hypothetical protein
VLILCQATNLASYAEEVWPLAGIIFRDQRRPFVTNAFFNIQLQMFAKGKLNNLMSTRRNKDASKIV